jgi:MFS family permease
MGSASDRPVSRGADLARLFVFLSGGALTAMAQMAILPSMPQLAARFAGEGDGPFIAQQVMTVAGPALAIGAPLSGWLSGIVGNRALLLVCAVLYAIAGLAGAFAPDLWSLLASRVALGLACGGVGATTAGLLADHYSGPVRDRLIGWTSVLGSGATIVSLTAAGVLVDRAGWRAPFVLYLVGIIVFLVALPVVSNAKRNASADHTESAGSLRAAAGYFALTIILSVIMNMIAVQGVFVLQSNGIDSSTLQSAVVNMTTVGSMAGAFAFGRLRPRMSFTAILTMTWGLLSVGVLGFALVHTVVPFGLFALLSGFGTGLAVPLCSSTVLRVVPPSANTGAMGLFIGCVYVGLLLNPFIAKPLRSAFGFQGSFLWIGFAASIGLAATLLWRLRNGRAAPSLSTHSIGKM